MIAVVAPIAGRLADRFGPVWPMSAGLAVLTTSMYLFAQIDIGTTYSGLLVPFILMGIGIALVMSPMSTAAMNAVDVMKAGVASGVLQMSRMVGGSVGVAATGAIFQSKLGSSFDPAALAQGSEQAKATFIDALASADGPRGDRRRNRLRRLGDPAARARRRSGPKASRREGAVSATPAAEIG